MKKLGIMLIIVAAMGLCFAPAWAVDLNEEVFGTNNQVTWLNPYDFESTLDFGVIAEVNNYGFFNYVERFSLTLPGWWIAPIHLPDGARLVRARLYAYDSSVFDIEFNVLRDNVGNHVRTQMIEGGGPVFTSGTPGYTIVNAPIVNGNQINNDKFIYWAFINLNTAAGFEGNALGDHRHRFTGVKLVWHRQISAAPATATFLDVPTTHMFFKEIEAMAASGITNGCGGGNYCPDDSVTRGQMAAFFARALGLYFN